MANIRPTFVFSRTSQRWQHFARGLKLAAWSCIGDLLDGSRDASGETVTPSLAVTGPQLPLPSMPTADTFVRSRKRPSLSSSTRHRARPDFTSGTLVTAVGTIIEPEHPGSVPKFAALRAQRSRRRAKR